MSVKNEPGETRLTSTETRWKRLIVRWTGRKGFAAILLFFILAVIVEVLLVYSFQMLGLVDQSALTTTILIPYVSWLITVSISPLFHLLPIGVIVVLLSSWTYLTKYTAFIPQRVEAAKRGSAPTRRELETRRFKSLRRFSKRLTRRLQRFGKALKSGVQRIRGVSYISKRLSFARAAVRSAALVVLIFLSAVLLFSLVEYPDLIHSWTLNLYRGSPAFLNLISGTTQWLNGVGQAVPALGGVGFAVNDALVGAAPGFRQSLTNGGETLTRPIVQLDVASKYVLAQNVAAWGSALIALAYGAYASSRPSHRSKGR